MKKKLTRLDLKKMKDDGRKAVWITAYDYITAQLAEEAGMDMLLVGDSLGMAVYGYSGTVPVTMDQCITHTEAVRRGAPNTFIIGDMPFGVQAKLLRVLETGEVLRVGRSAPEAVDVRLVTATHHDLAALVSQQRFREDLYYRLNVLRIAVPPLRDRREDIADLAIQGLQRQAHHLGRTSTHGPHHERRIVVRIHQGQ